MVDPAAQPHKIINPEVIATLVERYDRAIRVTELQYLPVKIAFLVTFVVTLFTKSAVYGVLVSTFVWLMLTLVMRQHLVVKLSQSPASRAIPFFRRLPRWSVAVICAAMLWYVTRETGWDGWTVLILAWVLDAAISILETRQMDSYIHWKEQILQQYPS